jgi:hypothetical protein
MLNGLQTLLIPDMTKHESAYSATLKLKEEFSKNP